MSSWATKSPAIIDDADLSEDEEDALARRFAKQYHLITNDDRLEKVAADLVRHFSGRGYRGKAMFVAIDKATAIRMYRQGSAPLGRNARAGDDAGRGDHRCGRTRGAARTASIG